MKLTLNGEMFEFDGRKQKVAEALAIEEAYGRRYAEWQDDMARGGAKALCTLAWLIWRRDGRDVALQDILDEKVGLDLNELLRSMMDAALEEIKPGDGTPADPTPAGSDPAGTPSTGTGTSESSASTSGSSRGKSAASKSRTSRP